MMKFLLPFALLLLTSVEGNLRGDLDKRLLKKGMRKSKKKDNMTRLGMGMGMGMGMGKDKDKDKCTQSKFSRSPHVPCYLLPVKTAK
jgi:hypothetical protein